jgi:hypothetical protein
MKVKGREGFKKDGMSLHVKCPKEVKRRRLSWGRGTHLLPGFSQRLPMVSFIIKMSLTHSRKKRSNCRNLSQKGPKWKSYH